MPVCKKCDTQFKSYIDIEGKQRNLSRRKYCLDCSPFGKNNTKKLHISNDRSCNRCKKEYSYIRGQNSKDICSSCMSNKRRFNRKQKLIDHKGGKCVKCGYNKCNSALTFHHIDPSTEKFNIGGNHTRKWKTLIEEVDKCILVCHNCHAEIHHAPIV